MKRSILMGVLLGVLALFANETLAAAQTSKYGIPSFHAPYTGAIQLPVTTVAKLPTCDAYSAGIVMVVTDATTPTYNGSLTGGGAVVVTVLCTGAAWKSQ